MGTIEVDVFNKKLEILRYKQQVKEWWSEGKFSVSKEEILLNLVINKFSNTFIKFSKCGILWLKKIYLKVSKYCMHIIFAKVSYSMLLGIICSKLMD